MSCVRRRELQPDASLVASSAQAAELDEILSRQAQAVGGSDNWAMVDNVRMQLDIKEPTFNKTAGLGATGEQHTVDSFIAPVEVGTRVMLIYRGKHLAAEVTVVEKPGSRFVGRVLEFENRELEFGDLKHGDLFRFNREDLRWID